MRLEEIDEDIMTQGSTYQPDNNISSDDEELEDEDLLDTSEPKITERGFGGGRTIFIVVGIIIVVFMIVGGLFLTKSNKDKRAEELLAQLEEEEESFVYSPEEIEELRVNGYTGKEIEQFLEDEQPASRLIEKAEKAKKEKYDAEIKPYLDGASDKFNELLEYTWLYGPDINYDVQLESEKWYYKNATLNLDYTKVPARGVQCFVRLTLIERTEEKEPVYIFMMMDPIRFAEIPVSGNIVTYIEYAVTDQGTIITSVEEKRIADK